MDYQMWNSQIDSWNNWIEREIQYREMVTSVYELNKWKDGDRIQKYG